MGGIAKKGDIIFVDRGLYKHYGVYNSEKSVIHFSTDSGAETTAANAYIRETTLGEFLKGGVLRVDRTIRAAFPPEEVARRALSLAGAKRGEYDFLLNNCEHFAHWCATGEFESAQVAEGAAAAQTIAEAASKFVTRAVVERVKKNRT
ncbi:MAG: lecithin retinol acyltransferase family protein [Spirochaetaceae bacterium]|jgi:hypothetical protein|nr:lecithin retinol acyltransferase family protein [Spirochaetaceae bacterium]